MSLIIHTIVKDGIVVCADTRTTHRDQNGVRYDDTAEKIIPFPNNIVISHCGSSNINEYKSTTNFLLDFRKQQGRRLTIFDLPLQLLNAFHKQGGNNDVVFKISGCAGSVSMCCTYTIYTKNDQIKLSTAYNTYGASYDGITDVCHAMLNSGIDYSTLTINGAIELTRSCLLENIRLCKYRNEQGIGGNCQTYIIDVAHDRIGWLDDDMNVTIDNNAPSDAYAKYQKAKMDRWIKAQEKKEKTK